MGSLILRIQLKELISKFSLTIKLFLIVRQMDFKMIAGFLEQRVFFPVKFQVDYTMQRIVKLFKIF